MFENPSGQQAVTRYSKPVTDTKIKCLLKLRHLHSICRDAVCAQECRKSATMYTGGKLAVAYKIIMSLTIYKILWIYLLCQYNQ